MEIWKEIKHYNLNNFEISNFSRIKNKKNNTIIDYTDVKDNKYIITSLTNNLGESINIQIHRIVALTFIPNPDNKPIVDHINGIKSNNNVNNLRWVNNVESNNNRNYAKITKVRYNPVNQYDLEGNLLKEWSGLQEIKEELKLLYGSYCSVKNCILGNSKTAIGYIWKKKEDKIDGEIWKTILIDGNNIPVSNLGRVKVKTGRITTGSLYNGYYRLTVGNKTYAVHRLVCIAFNHIDGYESLVVDHINRIKTDNRSENLRFTTQKENTKNINKKVIKRGLKPIIQYDIDMVKLNEFNSIREASKILEIGETSISAVCRGKRKRCGRFIFKYKNNFQ